MVENVMEELEYNNAESIEKLYEALGKIIKVHPEFTEQVFNRFNTALQSEYNDDDTLTKAYKVLGEIVKDRPELMEHVVTSIRTSLQVEKTISWAIRVAGNIDNVSPDKVYNLIGEIMQENSDLAKQVLKSINNELQLTKNNNIFLLQFENNDILSLDQTCKVLQEIVKARPELAEQVLDCCNNIQHENSTDNSISPVYKVLGEIVKFRPELAEHAFNSLNTFIQSKSTANDWFSEECYKTLGEIVKDHPELEKQVFNSFNIAIQSDKSAWIFSGAYQTLGKIVEDRPELAEQVLNTLQTTMQSDKNDWINNENFYDDLSTIAKVRPDLAEQVIKKINTSLQSGKNNNNSRLKAYNILAEIAKSCPELTEQVARTTLCSSVKTNSSQNYELFALSSCFKNIGVDDLTASFPQHRELIQAAYKLRFSNNDEIDYARNNFSLHKISEMSFAPQQRCLNVIMAQFGKENNIDAKETAAYRRQSTAAYTDNKDWMVSASFKGAETFGCWFPGYLKRTAPHLSVHDAVYWIPSNLAENKKETFLNFVQNNLIYADADGKKHTRPLAEMELIGKIWNKLPPEQEKSSYKEILAFCQSFKYADQEYESFATEEARWGVAAESYKDYENIYRAGLNTPEPFDSTKRFTFGQYTGKFLPRSDVRTGFFGNYTDCCQHFGGVGKSCAISTVKDPYSQLFVIENNKGRIVAGSWVWENTEGKYRDVCFDNIEAIGDFAKNPMINHIYEQAGRWLAQENNCRKVTIGLGYQDADVQKYQPTEIVHLPRQYNDKYSDAKGRQVLLTQNPQAEPLDKCLESPRFVRDVCLLDISEMDRVSEVCFPKGDQQLQKPEGLSGMVLVDAQKGVVGYCLYDKAQKEIYDIAVLPEYRNDKNASSRKLFGEVIRRIKDMDGEWYAQLRDQTTYKYLDTLAQQGLVSYQKHVIDHDMNDGNNIYKVSFNINKTPQKKTEKSLQPDFLQKVQNTR